ncbi:uncharacterized protein (DUF736 family) [Sphingomonas zeicaulis]|uniref:DUF736 domain-containing protein n=1 Tax=Sphingomonas zeicaulis TaxID=1632740 RepID=UPI003D1B4046
MNIGSMKQNDRGTYMGCISTLQFTAAIALREVNSANERAPRYEVFALSAAREWVQIGALFELFSNKDGSAFLNGRLEDPSFEKPLYISAFHQPDNSYNIVWSRPKDRAADVDRAMTARTSDTLPPLPGEDAGDTAPQGGGADTGGLGESTAPDAFGTGTPPASPKRGRKANDPAPADA